MVPGFDTSVSETSAFNTKEVIGIVFVALAEFKILI